MNMNYKTIGITDAVNSCDCCGKSGLKVTVEMQGGDGETVHFGTTCATRHSGRAAKIIRAEANAVHAANVKLATVRYRHTNEKFKYDVALAEASKLALRPGKEFAAFVHDAADAADKRRNEIAEQFRVSAYEIN